MAVVDTTAKLTINGKLYEVDPEVSVGSSLVDFLHSQGLTGTHFTCYQGGCGSCTVVGKHTDPNTGEKQEYAFNSCLAMVHACDGWEITTVEGLGNRHDGYHVVQERLADFSGTQCGFCSPGMVMNMYGLTQQKKDGWTASDAESLLDGNLCRCTGYRPILDAWKSVTPQDIEDLPKCGKSGGCCKKKGNNAKSSSKVGCRRADAALPRDVVGGGVTLYQPETLQAMYDILNGLEDGTTYKLTCGNTGQGIWWDGGYMAYINTRTVKELNVQEATDEGLVFGAAVSLADVISALEDAGKNRSGYSYAVPLAKHWRHVASTQIRNLGSWAGNLGLKVAHHDFPSDIFLTMVGTDATITTGLASDGSVTSHTVEDLLPIDLNSSKQVILQLKFPPMSDDVVFRSYKITPRAVWAHAIVNAVFRFQVDRENKHTVIGTPTIAFGGINPTFVHASETEALLSGASLEDVSVLQAAMTSLASEVLPDNLPNDASPEYRVSLTQNLLYKTILGIVGNVCSPNIINGATDLERPLSSAKQTYDQNTEVWPLGKPIPKLEAKIQCSGEAEYVAFMPTLSNELEGQFIQATQGDANYTIDATEALKVPGVVGFICAEDITGVNNIIADADPFKTSEELFPSGRVSYYGQALGMIVAENYGACQAGKAKVKVTYSDIKKPVTDIEEAMKNPMGTYAPPFILGDVEAGFAASAHIIEGAMTRDGQFHFSMETQVARAIPTEDGLDVYSGTQWASETQRSIAQIVGIPDNSINISVRRIGGGFGSKIDRCNIIASATALAAHKVRRPVKCHLDLKTNMTMIGWRDPFHCSYKIGVDDAGVLQAVEAYMTCDSGYNDVDASSPNSVFFLRSCYDCPNWKVMPQIARTNTAINTWCRAPGWVDGIVHMENMLEHVSVTLGLDPVEVRKKNLMKDGGTRHFANRNVCSFYKSGDPMKTTIPRNLISTMLDQMISKAEVEKRKQELLQYNQENIWKKRGMCVMPMLFPYGLPPEVPYGFTVVIAIYQHDGTVSISHGGTEMGQGINTKVAQVAASELGCPLDLIKIKVNNTHSNANSQCDGGSLGSDINAFCAQEAAKKLRARLDAVKEKMGKEDVTWLETVQTAYAQGVDISERYCNLPGEVKNYAVFAVACAEVHLDVLTGQFIVDRADLLQDAGLSMSPLVDIGQIEGAWVMGQGLFTCEQVKFDPNTGERISNDTWTYKIPTGLDIPVDFRVEMLSKTPNPIGVKSSKVTGEPPLCLSYSVALALRQAVSSARADRGVTGWFRMDTPLTIERLQQHCLVDPLQFTFT